MMHINVTKKLRGAHGSFLFAVNMDIEERSLVALSGISGSGKTSLLRIIAGLMEPDSGEILAGGETWYSSREGINRKPQEREIGFVFQEYSLFPHMTVRENLAYAGKDKNTIDELLSLSELEMLADQYPPTLSGGQKQRVALARAIARKPKILLLDEPFSAIDPVMKSKLQDGLLRMHAHFPITTILVSHNMSEIYKICPRMVTIDNGHIVLDGTPRKLLTERDTSQKFSFVGEIVDIHKADIVYTVLIASGQTINEVVLTANDVADLNIGDHVVAATKAFQPTVRKISA